MKKVKKNKANRIILQICIQVYFIYYQLNLIYIRFDNIIRI